MHLAAMMGLVIEHVRDQKPFRLAQVRFDRTGVIRELAGEGRSIESVRPVAHDGIEGFALALQVLPVSIKRYGFGNSAAGRWRVGRAVHPDAVSPKQVVERRVDRTEKCSA